MKHDVVEQVIDQMLGEAKDIRDGDRVRLTPDMAGSETGIFTVSQNDPERKRCWIGDPKDSNRGWYAHWSDLVLVRHGRQQEAEEPPMGRPKLKLGTRMKTIPMNQDDDPDGLGMGSKVTGLQVADRLAQAEDLILSMRFVVSNDDMSRADLVRIKDRASSIIGQATEILNSCESRLARREHD